MFLLFLLLYGANCKIGKLVASNSVTLLPFGFRENATFRFLIDFPFSYKVQLYLLTINELRAVNRAFLQPCLKLNTHISNINVTEESNLTYFYYEGKINESDTYTPIISVCYPRQRTYSVTFQYINPDMYDDYREKPTPVLFLFFSLYYIILSCFWMHNIITYKKHVICVHMIASLLPLSKSMQLLSKVLLVQNKFEKEYIDDSVTYINLIFQFFHWSLMLYLSVSVSAGYGLLRPRLSRMESIRNALVSVIYSFSLSFFLFTNTKTVFLLVLLLFLSIYYLRIVVLYFAQFSEVDSKITEDPIASKKVDLMLKFFSLVIFFFLFSSIVSPLTISPFKPTLIFTATIEFEVMIFHLCIYRFFRVTADMDIYHDNDDDELKDLVIVDQPNQAALYFLS